MVEMHAKYTGSKHCEIVHGPSRSRLETDAPKDNQGKGEAFSPTDLMGAALSTCILTTIAIMAERDGISVEGAEARVVKEMNANPRRVARLPVEVRMPKGIPLEQRARLEAAGRGCPVHKSLHPDVDAPISFVWPD